MLYTSCTDAERQEVADTAQQTRLFAVVVEEAFRVELARVVPRRLVEMNCLVVTDNDRVTRDHVAA